MKKILLLLTMIATLFIVGCNSTVDTNEAIRIKGIVDACKSNTDRMKVYLDSKVESGEITQEVAIAIY